MKKLFMIGAIFSVIALITACSNTTTEEFPKNGQDFKFLMTEDLNICKNYHLQVLVDTIYSEDYLLYFTNQFRDNYAKNEKSTVYIYDTTFDATMLKANVYSLSDFDFLSLANHTLFISSWDDPNYGFYYLLKDDDRYKKLTQSK